MGAHGRKLLEGLEGDTWKRLVHEGEVDGYLRDALLNPRSDVPMSRDAGYHALKGKTLGISRRALQAFLGKQAVLQITRDAPGKMKRPSALLKGKGYCEIDLVEAKGKDIGKLLHRPTKDFYWITFIDRLTGYLEVERILRKDFKTVVPQATRIVKRMGKALGTPVKYVRSDSGSEFKGEFKEALAELGIRTRFVKSAGRLEQANRTFQKIWYRLLRLGRGADLGSLDQQALAIFNNTVSSVTGRTPFEALEADEAQLTKAHNDYKKKQTLPKYRAVPIRKGDRCRYLIDSVRGKDKTRKLDYKAYRGKHWSDVYAVAKVR